MPKTLLSGYRIAIALFQFNLWTIRVVLFVAPLVISLCLVVLFVVMQQLFVFPSNYAASSFKLRCANALTKNNGPYAAGAAIIHCLVVYSLAQCLLRCANAPYAASKQAAISCIPTAH